jgi:hypothetical protein
VILCQHYCNRSLHLVIKVTAASAALTTTFWTHVFINASFLLIITVTQSAKRLPSVGPATTTSSTSSFLKTEVKTGGFATSADSKMKAHELKEDEEAVKAKLTGKQKRTHLIKMQFSGAIGYSFFMNLSIFAWLHPHLRIVQTVSAVVE